MTDNPELWEQYANRLRAFADWVDLHLDDLGNTSLHVDFNPEYPRTLDVSMWPRTDSDMIAVLRLTKTSAAQYNSVGCTIADLAWADVTIFPPRSTPTPGLIAPYKHLFTEV